MMCCSAPGGRRSRKKVKPDLEAQRKPLYICVCGDGGVGKTAMLIRNMQDEFPDDYQPTIFDDYEGTTMVDGHEIRLCLRDTAGQEAYDAINDASFTGVDCFLVCFALCKGREASLSNVAAKWAKQLRDRGHLQNGAKMILVGTKMDAMDAGVDEEAPAVQRGIGAISYMRTSAKMPREQGGVPQVFDEAVRACMYVE